MRLSMKAAVIVLASTLVPVMTAEAEAATVTVKIDNYMFQPATVVIHPGDQVTWVNNDTNPHTATSLDGKAFNSGALDPGGASWSFTFTKAGEYKYRCALHPDMQATVVVQ